MPSLQTSTNARREGIDRRVTDLKPPFPHGLRFESMCISVPIHKGAYVYSEPTIRNTDLPAIARASAAYGRERAIATRRGAAIGSRTRSQACRESHDGVEGLQHAGSGRLARAQSRQTDDDRKATTRAIATVQPLAATSSAFE